MGLLEDKLYVKKSLVPGAGKGLFTKVSITKGTYIVEYRGEILTWKEVEKMADDRNGYVFFVNSKHVIDAWNFKKEFGRYANDAKGITRIPEAKTNAEYVVKKKRCYIVAYRDIPAGGEIFVEYGAEYWQAIRYNIRVERRDAEKALKEKAKKAAGKKSLKKKKAKK